MKYDYLVVGAGLFGSIFAHEMYRDNKKVLVIDKSSFIGGMCHTDIMYGIPIHSFGAHIFHTDSADIWIYMNKFSKFNNYQHRVKGIYGKDKYDLPFNMNTFYQMFGVTSVDEAKAIISKTNKNIDNPKNLEEQCISMVGEDVYKKLVKEYTEKQWGEECKNLPIEIIKRIPVRWEWNSNYFDDVFQGIPVNGYTPLIENMLEGIEVKLNTPYDKTYYDIADKIIYTGPIDELLEYKFGKLKYRGLQFVHEVLNIPQFQELAVMNYTDSTPYTRIIEHKHFYGIDSPNTIITKEYPSKVGCYYPVNDSANMELYEKYKKELPSKIIPGGRLGNYMYCDMNTTIKEALKLVREERRK